MSHPRLRWFRRKYFIGHGFVAGGGETHLSDFFPWEGDWISIGSGSLRLRRGEL